MLNNQEMFSLTGLENSNLVIHFSLFTRVLKAIFNQKVNLMYKIIINTETGMFLCHFKKSEKIRSIILFKLVSKKIIDALFMQYPKASAGQIKDRRGPVSGPRAAGWTTLGYHIMGQL